MRKAPGAVGWQWLPPGLTKLLQLRLAATRRETLRRLRTPAGVALLLAVLAGGVAFLLFRGVSPSGAMLPADQLRVAGTYFLALVVMLQIVTRGEGDVLGFTPAEADQLFGAPFRPEEILRYKLTLMVVAVASTSVLSVPFFLLYGRNPLTTLLFSVLVTSMIQFGSMTVAMVLRVGRQARWVAGGLTVALVGTLLWQRDVAVGSWEEMLALGRSVLDHPVGGVLLAPFSSGAAILASASLGEAAPHVALLTVIDAALLIGLLRLGRSHWVELAADGAQHIGNLVERVRGGSLLAATRVRWVRLPQVPRWGGVGPLARRQLAEVVRRPATLALLAGFALFPQVLWWVVPSGAIHQPEGERLGWLMVGMTGLLLAVGQTFIPTLLRTDFRGDLDRLDLLLALPVRRSALVAGQVLPGVVVLTAVGAITAAGIAWRTWPRPEPALVILLAQPALAAWQLTVENVVFLALPHRVEMGEAAIEGLGKGVLTYIIGQALTWGGGVAALMAGFVVGFAAGPLAGAASGALVLWVASFAMGLLGAARLRGLDPTLHIR